MDIYRPKAKTHNGAYAETMNAIYPVRVTCNRNHTCSDCGGLVVPTSVQFRTWEDAERWVRAMDGLKVGTLYYSDFLVEG